MKNLEDLEEYHEDRHVKAVIKRFKERSRIGQTKYGTTLERKDLDFIQWLTHLQEELMDATLYLERLKFDAKKAISKSKTKK